MQLTRVHVTVVVVLLAFSGLMMFGLDEGTMEAEAATIISSYEVWDEPVHCTSNVWVQDGGYLFIEEGTLIQFDPGVEMKVDGGLNINGTYENPVLLTSTDNSSTQKWSGINIYDASSVRINRTELRYAEWSLNITATDDCLIMVNDIHHCKRGPWFHNCHACNISYNFIHDIDWEGMQLEYSSNNTLYKNNISYTSRGITMSMSSDRNIFKYNEIYDNYNEGLVLESSDNVDIWNNYFGYNGRYSSEQAIEIKESSYNDISDNNIHKSGSSGILIGFNTMAQYSSSNWIVGNDIAGNGHDGVQMDTLAVGTTIWSNEIHDNSRYDVSCFYLFSMNISHNAMYGSDQGIHFADSVGGTFYDNVIMNHDNDAIFIKGSYEVRVLENFISNEPKGVQLESSFDTKIDGNTIENVQWDGVFGDTDCYDIHIRQNEFTNIGMDGIHFWGADINCSGNNLTGCENYGIHVNDMDWGNIDKNRIITTGVDDQGVAIKIGNCAEVYTWDNFIKGVQDIGIDVTTSNVYSSYDVIKEVGNADIFLLENAFMETRSSHFNHGQVTVQGNSLLDVYYGLNIELLDEEGYSASGNIDIKDAYGTVTSYMDTTGIWDHELHGYIRDDYGPDYSGSEYEIHAWKDNKLASATVDMREDDVNLALTLHEMVMFNIPMEFHIVEDSPYYFDYDGTMTGDGPFLYTYNESGNLTIDWPDMNKLQFTVSPRNEHWVGVEDIRIEALDIWGDTAEHLMTIIVGEVNDVPYIDPLIGDITIDEGDGGFVLSLWGHGQDPDLQYNPDETLYWWVEAPPGVQVDGNNNTDNITLKVLDPDFYGEIGLMVHLEDSYAARASQQIKLYVNSVNDAPIVNSPGDRTISKGMPTQIDMTSFVSDIDTDFDDLSLSVDSKYASVEDMTFTLDYPTGIDLDQEDVNISVSDGIDTGWTIITITLEETQTYTISGVVYYGEGGPIDGSAKGCLVEAVPKGSDTVFVSSDEPGGAPVEVTPGYVSTTTDNDGGFSLDVGGTDEYMLTITPPDDLLGMIEIEGGDGMEGYLVSQRTINVNDANVDNVVIILQHYKVGDVVPSYFKLDGTIYFEDGPKSGPAQGCTVKLYFKGTDTPMVQITNPDGTYGFNDLIKGSYRIVVEPPREDDWLEGTRAGYKTYETDMEINSHLTEDVNLEYYDGTGPIDGEDGGENPGPLSGPGCFILAAILLLLLIVVIIIIVVIVMRKGKKKPKEEDVEAPTADPYAGVKKSNAIEPEVEGSDIFDEHKATKGKPPVRKPKTITIETGTAQPMEPKAQPTPVEAPAEQPAPALETEVPDEVIGLEEMDPIPELQPLEPEIETAQTVMEEMTEAPPQARMDMLALPPAKVMTDDSETDMGSSIDEILVINRDGMLMDHYARTQSSEIDKDVLSGMLTAVQSFVKDSFGSMNTTLKRLEMQDFTVLIEPGKHISVVGITRDKDNRELNDHLLRMMREVDSEMAEKFEAWDGDMESIRDIDKYIQKLLEGGYE